MIKRYPDGEGTCSRSHDPEQAKGSEDQVSLSQTSPREPRCRKRACSEEHGGLDVRSLLAKGFFFFPWGGVVFLIVLTWTTIHPDIMTLSSQEHRL